MSKPTWIPQIGEQVYVVPGSADWATDWADAAGQPLPLWVAGTRAMYGGGIDVTVSEQWPLPPTRLFTTGSLTDGFVVGREGERDHLAPYASFADAVAEKGGAE